MNLTELKTRPPSDLVELAESMGLENMARSRKQDIIFSILKAHARMAKTSTAMVLLRFCRTASGFLRSADSSYSGRAG